MTTSATDRLARQFSDSTLPFEDWTHEAHLRVGLWHLLRFTPAEAMARMQMGIRALDAAHGTPNSGDWRYHETVTQFYVVLLGDFLEGHDRSMPEDRVAESLIELLGDRDLPLQYYSRARLSSPSARRQWVEPDLRPLPSVAETGSPEV